MALQNQRRFSVRVAGIDFGVWDTNTGLEVDSVEKKFYPGAVRQQVSLGGGQEYSNLIATRYFDPGRDWPAIARLMGLAGGGIEAAFEGIELFLDADGNVVQEGGTYIGTLKRVKGPDGDSESDDEAMVEIEITIVEIVTS